jgi:hypothetical protein
VKTYPSIPRSTGQDFQEFDAYVFDKLDGSNLRWEWARKSGWYKHGTRSRLFDETDEVFGPAIPLFQKTLAEPLEKIARDERWERMIVFVEFWGPRSLGGLHEPSDEKRLTLFDVNPHKKGILGPQSFLKMFGHLDIPYFLGTTKWTRGFVEQVRRGEIPNITDEGVVGKAGEGHKLIMAKAKTQAWIDKILARYGEAEGRKIVES